MSTPDRSTPDRSAPDRSGREAARVAAGVGTAGAAPGRAGSAAGTVNVLLARLDRLDPPLPVPTYAHPGDAGADLVTAVDVTLDPGQRVTVPTGVALALPDGYAGFVHPRSGLASRHGVTVVNAPGTVDAGYRGEVRVTLLNTDRERPVVLHRGDRIAQLIVQRVERAVFHPVDALPGSVRGAGGHGSTGGITELTVEPTGGGGMPDVPAAPAER